MQTRIRVGKLEKLQDTLSQNTAAERLAWAENMFGPKAVATSCLGADCAVLLHMLSKTSPRARVFVVAPGDLSTETLVSIHEVEKKLGLEVTLLDPQAPTRTEGEIAIDGGEQLSAALDDAFCWISDTHRRSQNTREGLNVLERLSDGLYQLNPLFDWSDEQIAAYAEQHGLPRPSHLPTGTLTSAQVELATSR